jgi:hypothetical protein
MCSSSALVLLQGGRHTLTQVPSKAFEYLRSGRPLLVLAPADSATAKVLAGFPGIYQADPEDAQSIAAALGALYHQWRRGTRIIDRDGANLDRYERRRTAAALAQVLNALVPQPAAPSSNTCQ